MKYLQMLDLFYWFYVYEYCQDRPTSVALAVSDYKRTDASAFVMNICTLASAEKYIEENNLHGEKLIAFNKYCKELESGDADYFIAKLGYANSHLHIKKYNELLRDNNQTIFDVLSEVLTPTTATIFVDDIDLYNPTTLLRFVKWLHRELFLYEYDFEFADMPGAKKAYDDYNTAIADGYITQEQTG